MASCRRGWREREREREKKKSIELSTFFFLPVFLSLSGSNRRSTTIGGNLRKALALQASETIVSFRGWAGFMEVAAWNFATRPGKAVFHREISLFIGRIESIGCPVILSNRFHAQPPRYFPRVFENLWSRRSRSIFILSSFFSFFSSIFITNIPSCLYIFVFASVLKMGQAEKRRTKRRKLLRLYKRGARQRRRELFSEERKLGCLKRNRKFEGIDPYFQFLLWIWLVIAILTKLLLLYVWLTFFFFRFNIHLCWFLLCWKYKFIMLRDSSKIKVSKKYIFLWYYFKSNFENWLNAQSI